MTIAELVIGFMSLEKYDSIEGNKASIVLNIKQLSCVVDSFKKMGAEKVVVIVKEDKLIMIKDISSDSGICITPAPLLSSEEKSMKR